MESRAWGAYRLPVPEADTLVIGASPRRSDRFAIGVFAVQLDVGSRWPPVVQKVFGRAKRASKRGRVCWPVRQPRR